MYREGDSPEPFPDSCYSSGESPLTDGGVATDRHPPLPAANASPARILALSGTSVQQYHADTISALAEDTDPDAIVAAPPAESSVAPALRRQIDKPIFQAGHGMRPNALMVSGDDILIVATPSGTRSLSTDTVNDRLPNHKTSEDNPHAATVGHRCIITDALSLSVSPYERSATVEGFDEYSDRLPVEWSHDTLTHLSTALRPGFISTIDSLPGGHTATVVGIGDSDAELGVGRDNTATNAALVEVYRNGAINTETLDPERFGLRSITQVGQQRADTLRQAGFNTPDALAEADLSEITDLNGIGNASAATIHSAAKAVDTGSIIPAGTDSLPHGDPVFIDIETDGRNPSTAWLIGVLDGDVETGNYLAFREEHPGDGTHLDAFMTWLTGSAAGRPVVAWHGYNFDFPVIEDQLRQHCPEHLAAWNDTYCFDALYWARDKNGGNAALPGRTNTLEAVARPLGWEPSTTGIDGGTVAEVYAAWRTRFERATDPHSVTPPPWERLERYCEDDVRALATIYDALRDAARRDPDSSTPTGDDSTQGALSDFT